MDIIIDAQAQQVNIVYNVQQMFTTLLDAAIKNIESTFPSILAKSNDLINTL